LAFLFFVFWRFTPLLFMNLLFILKKKKNNRPLPGAISQIVHWEIEKGGVYSEFS